MDILESFIKKLEHEINTNKIKLTQIENELSQVKLEQFKLKEKYKLLEKESFNDPLAIHMKSKSMVQILKKIKELESKKIKLEDKAEKIRIIIKEKNAEKKAIQNYQEKIQKEKEIEELKKETQLIDEIFNRNN